MATTFLARRNLQAQRLSNASFPTNHSGCRSDLRLCARMTQFLLAASFVLVVMTTSFMLEEMHYLTVVLTSSTALVMQSQPPITILVQLSGELGNHLSKMAHGFGVEFWLRETNNNQVQRPRLVMRHQGPRYVYKWQKAQEDLHRCFPSTRVYNVSQGYDHTAYKTYVQQYTSNRTSPVYQQWESFNQAQDTQTVAQRFQKVAQAYQEKQHQLLLQGEESDSPFIVYSNQFVHGNHFWMDRYYDEYRKIFKMAPDCCPRDVQVPEPDETVVHFRNYLEEMPRKRRLSHSPFHEANPSTLAHVLLGHLKPGVDRVALIGPTGGHRFRGNASSVHALFQAHKRALNQRGIVTRIIDNGNGTADNDMADFCFLVQAQKELVGLETSTFVYWAAILGQAQRVRLYSIATPASDSPHTNTNKKWPTNTLLQQRIQFETVQQIEHKQETDTK